MERLADVLTEGCGRGLCKRIIAVVKAANILDMSFLEAFEKQPTELLQLLSLKAQDSFEEARLLVETYPMPATSIAKILAESFLKVRSIISSPSRKVFFTRNVTCNQMITHSHCDSIFFLVFCVKSDERYYHD